jgi:hypothetical protein
MRRAADRSGTLFHASTIQKFFGGTSMPRQRIATNVLELSGAFAKNPNRRRVDPVTSKPIGRAPKPFPLTFEQAWRYILKCAPEGVLRDDRDRLWVEVVAHLLVEFRADPAKFHPAKLQRLTSMLAALGMSPADASRVAAPPKAKRNEFDED